MPALGPEPTLASGEPPREDEDLQGTLQRVWDEAASNFADAVRGACSWDPGLEPTLRTKRVHQPSELWLKLDDCVSDEDDATNFAYGKLHATFEIAYSLGVRIKADFPAIEDE